jgi:hypothetical protein
MGAPTAVRASLRAGGLIAKPRLKHPCQPQMQEGPPCRATSRDGPLIAAAPVRGPTAQPPPPRPCRASGSRRYYLGPDEAIFHAAFWQAEDAKARRVQAAARAASSSSSRAPSGGGAGAEGAAGILGYHAASAPLQRRVGEALERLGVRTVRGRARGAPARTRVWERRVTLHRGSPRGRARRPAPHPQADSTHTLRSACIQGPPSITRHHTCCSVPL